MRDARVAVAERIERGPYLVRPEMALVGKRAAAFESLSSARYFARTWAHKSTVPIVVVDGTSGAPVERYSTRLTTR